MRSEPWAFRRFGLRILYPGGTGDFRPLVVGLSEEILDLKLFAVGSSYPAVALYDSVCSLHTLYTL